MTTPTSSQPTLPVTAIPLRLEITDVAQLLRSSLDVFLAQAEALGIEVRVDVVGSGAPLRARVDPEKVAWAVTTLVGNALRYVKPSTSAEGGGSVLVHCGINTGAASLFIAVHDDGPGIPGDRLATLLTRSQTAHHATGLALLLVRDVVNAHGGRLEVESRCETREHGTSVTLHIPRGMADDD